MTYRIGQQLGNYRIMRPLGHGGFADVYLGEHRYLKSYAALKVLRVSLKDEDAQRFLSEAQTLVRLRHPNIVRVLEYSIDRGTPVLVMDYAAGGTTRQRHPRGSLLSLATTVTYVKQVAAALQYAHNRSLIHRDVKPENILLGSDQSILLSDFGLALFSPSPDQLSTQEGAGTLPYTAPEQLRGRPSFASDQYSLGTVVYEWLCGRRPFEGKSWEIVNQHFSAAPPPLRKWCPELPAEVESVVLRTLAKEPQERFVSVQAFAFALERASQQVLSDKNDDEQATAPLKTISHPPTATSSDSRTLRQIFLSASPSDVAFAARLKADLNAHGTLLANDLPGDPQNAPDQEEIVRQAIRASHLVLIVLSSHTQSTRTINEHMRIANMYGRRIVFVWAEGNEAAALLPVPDTWGKTAVIDLFDARGASYEPALKKIVACLEQGTEITTLPAPAISDLQSEPRNPYKGLRAFTTSETADFFGRNSLVEEMVEKLRNILSSERPRTPATRLLTVIGPSGSGKSSVVMAGLLPRLQQGALLESKQWIYLDPIVPGTHPFESLALRLTAYMPEKSLKAIHEDLRDDTTRGLHLLATQLVKQSGRKVLLVIDQFEELFAQQLSEKERQHFIDVLLTAVTEPQGPVVAVLTLRADFYDRPMRYPKLSRLIEAYHTPVLPMELHDLRAIIEEPAALSDVQLTFEGNLVGDLLFETQGQAGALPLLEFTLDQLFQRREGHWLTLQAYQQIGGVKGALAKHAESIYASLSTEEHRNLARTLFLRLIDPGITEQDTTRRRANLAELVLPDAQQTQIMKEVADTFVSTRLLTTNEIAGETTIEVSHEALIREWARLGTWLRETRSDIALQHTLSSDVSDWLQRGRPTDRLYRGTRLTEAQAWAERNTPSEREVAFLQASTAEHQRQEAEELSRQARELTLKRQTVNRLRGLVAVLSLLLVASIVFASITQGLLHQVNDQKALIQAQAENASSRALAAQANYTLAQGQIDKALLLSVKANQTDNNFDARDSLLNALEYSPHLVTMLQENAAVDHVIFRPDGRMLIALGSLDNSAEVTLWDMKTRKGHTTYLDFHGVVGTISSWALSPNGQLVAGANDQGLWFWETKKGAQIARLETIQPAQSQTTGQSYTSPVSTPITFSPDGTMLASSRCTQYDSVQTSCLQSHLLLWNVTTQTPTSQQLGNIPAPITRLVFSLDGKTLLSSTQTLGAANVSGGLQLWDVASRTQLVQSFAGYSGAIADFVLSTDGKTLAASDGKANIYLWDVQSQKPLGAPLSMKGAHYLAFSPNSKTLAASDINNTVHIWNILTSPPTDMPLLGHGVNITNSVTSLSFSPDGQTLASGDSDGALLVWNMGTDSSLKHEIPYTSRLSSATFSPDGKAIVIGDTTGKITFSDATTGKPLDILDATASPDTQESATVDSGPLWVKSLAFSPDKRLLAAGRYDGMIFVWDAATKKPIAHFRDEKQLINIAFNMDSHTLAASYNNGSILLWDSIKGRVLHQLRPPIQNSNSASSLAFSPDGTLLASGDNDAVVFWDFATDKLIGQPLKGHQSNITNVAFSPDGKTLASIDSHNNILLWDVATKKPLLTTPLNNTDTSIPFELPNPTGLMFSPDGTTLAAGGNQSVTLWNIVKRERFTHAFRPRGSSVLLAQIRGVTSSPDGQHLLVLSDTYTANYLATLWDINRSSWQTYACSIVNRNFTQDEWNQFLGGDPYQKVCSAFPVDSSVTQDELTKAHADMQAGNRSDAQSVYAQAQREASQLDDPELANNVCWWGSLDQFADMVSSSCERAIALNPYYGQYHDSRGVARALMGNRQGAIDDFNFFVQWAKGQESTPNLAHAIAERTGWIQALEAGRNPFNAQTLKALRVESGIDIA